MRARRLSTLALSLFVAAYAGMVFSHAGRSIGGSDSSGYYNAARALAAGEPIETIDLLDHLEAGEETRRFIPLGYVPGARPGTMVPFYPMGLPLQFAAAAAVFGWELGPFLVPPAAAVASLLLLFGVARELGVSRLGALAAVAMLGSLPVFVHYAVQPMGDDVAALWALATMFAALRSRRHAAWAVAAGAAFGIGVLVRPTSAILIVPLVFALEPRPRIWALFAAGGAPCAALLAVFNQHCYGSPLRSGYGVGGALDDFKWANFPARLRHYGYWIAAMLTPLVPAAWLALPIDRRRPPRVRVLLFTWFAAFFLLYCFYGPYETWWYTRYLLPGIPALLVGAVLLVEARFERLRPTGRRVASVAVAFAFLLACGAGVRLGLRFHALEIGASESVYPESIRWAIERLPPNRLVVAMQVSGAMRSYGLAPLVRWDFLDAETFPAFRRRMEGAGFEFYALLFPFETEDAMARLPGAWETVGKHRHVTLWRLR